MVDRAERFVVGASKQVDQQERAQELKSQPSSNGCVNAENPNECLLCGCCDRTMVVALLHRQVPVLVAESSSVIATRPLGLSLALFSLIRITRILFGAHISL